MAHDAQTVQQAQWEYIDQLAQACEQHGVDLPTLWQHLETLQVTAPTRAPGMLVRAQTYRNGLPPGTVVEAGDPATYRNYGVWMLPPPARTRWVQVLGCGALNDPGVPIRILEMRGSREVPAWVTAKATPDDVRATREWLARAYRAAKQVQSSRGWCPTFDHILEERLGLNRAILRQSQHGGVGVGDTVTAEEAALLPQGTVLRHHRADESHAVWYMRVPVLRNAASTRRVLAVNGHAHMGGHFAARMVVCSFPTGIEQGLYWHEQGIELGLGFVVHAERVWDAMPVGTVLEYNTSRFVIRLDDRQRNEMVPWPDHGRHAGYRPAQLDRQQFRGIVAFPDTTGAGA